MCVCVCVCARALSPSVMSDPFSCLLYFMSHVCIGRQNLYHYAAWEAPPIMWAWALTEAEKKRNPLKLPQIKEKWNICKATTWNTKVLNAVTFQGYLKILSNRSISFHLSPWSLSPLLLGLLFLTHHLLPINDPTWLPAASSDSTAPDPPIDGYLYFS